MAGFVAVPRPTIPSMSPVAPDVGPGTVKATGSTAARTLRDRFADIVNVKDYGAVGNGTTDDTTAVQAAINAAVLAGGHVFVPAGTYIIKNVELFAGNVLQGAGRALTKLKLAPGLTGSDFLTDRSGHPFSGFTVLYSSYPSGGYNGNQPLDGIAICDLTVDGNYSTQTATYQGWGIYLNGITRARIENVITQNCLSHGWTLKESTFSEVRGVDSISNGHSTGGGGGDGGVLLSRCSDNLVIGCRSVSNASGGFEDEGRNGAYNPVNRNARNRWVDCLSKDNGDNGWDAIFADGLEVRNLTVVGGSTSVNSAAIQLLGTNDALIDGLYVTGITKQGARIWPEIYGANGWNYRTTIRNATFLDTTGKPIIVEGLQGGSIQAVVRGVGGGHAVSLSATGYGRTGGNPDTHASGGYGMGAYQVGKPYLATGQVGAIGGQGDVVTNVGNVYQLTTALTGTGLSVTAPTGTTTSADNGGTWTYIGPIGSTDLELSLEYDGAYGSKAQFALYAYNPTGLTLRNSHIRTCSDHNIWIDGTSAGASGFRMSGSRSLNSGGRGITFTAGVLTGASSSVMDCDLSGGSTALNLNTLAGQLFVRNVTGYVSSNSGVTGAIATGATVNHGLATTPASVQLTAADGTPTNVYADTLGSTSFKVNYTGGGTHAFYWSARLAAEP